MFVDVTRLIAKQKNPNREFDGWDEQKITVNSDSVISWAIEPTLKVTRMMLVDKHEILVKEAPELLTNLFHHCEGDCQEEE